MWAAGRCRGAGRAGRSVKQGLSVEHDRSVLSSTAMMCHGVSWVMVMVTASLTGAGCQSLLRVSNAPHNTLTLDAHHTLHFVHPKGEAHVLWGLTLPEGAEGTPCGEGNSCLDFGVARVVVTVEDHCQKVAWTSGGNGNLTELRDCVLLEGHWYGGGQQTKQPWPMEKEPHVEVPFITADMFQSPEPLYGGVSEAYWVSSLGVAVRVDEQTPLFLNVPDVNGDRTADELCLAARHDPPYAAAPGSPLTLTYFLCSAEDVRQSEGFRVTLWVHPFINSDCSAFTYAEELGYLIKDASGTTLFIRWWNSEQAGLVDFTNPEAAAWWTQRLVDLQQQFGVDSFKFDAGETAWLPDNYTLEADKLFWPSIYSVKFIETVTQFGPMIEARLGRGTQRHAAFIRMLDKYSSWGRDNGLKSLIPTLLHFGLVGYPFVLPDMIGGNTFEGPTKQLFVRWAQANALMPALQFSMLPWEFDEEVTELCQEVTRLHTQYTPLLLSLAEEATTSVAPMIRPTWWLCPTLEECLTADQQFLVGDDLLVVPVVDFINGDTVHAVIPPGEWKQANTGMVVTGPQTLTVSNITLDTLVYFTRAEA